MAAPPACHAGVAISSDGVSWSRGTGNISGGREQEMRECASYNCMLGIGQRGKALILLAPVASSDQFAVACVAIRGMVAAKAPVYLRCRLCQLG